MKHLALLALLVGCKKPVTAPVAAHEGRPAVATATPVWLDIDPAVGEPDRDVDDGVALLQAIQSPELAIRGVSIVHGNTELERGDVIGRDLVARWAPELPVYTGASGPHRQETEASRALADALRAEPLTVFVLGPATNLATVLEHHPELAENVERVIAVAGRYEGQRFTTGTTNTRGHRDFNFELDHEAFGTILRFKLDLVLAPFEISRKVWMRSADLDELASSERAGVLVEPARGWLKLWVDTFAVDGFNPFDTLAVGYLTNRDLLTCDRRLAHIEVHPDDVTEARMQGVRSPIKPYLIVRSQGESVPGTVVTWCHDVDSAAFLTDLKARLTR